MATQQVPDLRALLPEPVRFAVSTRDLDAPLWPVEEAALARAGGARRAEFVTGRACARAALAELGLPAAAIPVGGHRCPIWPAGSVGSITHCAGLRAAVVARTDDVVALGVDAEPNWPLPEGVTQVVALPGELPASGLRLGVAWVDRLLFSAKEAAFKAWYPSLGYYLEFTDVRIELRGNGTFAAQLLRGKGARLQGRWAATTDLIVTTTTSSEPG